MTSMKKTGHHRLNTNPQQTIATHLHARPLLFTIFDGVPTLYIEADSDQPGIRIELRMLANGMPVPPGHEYLGTAPQVGHIAWHLYAPSTQIEDGRFISPPPVT